MSGALRCWLVAGIITVAAVVTPSGGAYAAAGPPSKRPIDPPTASEARRPATLAGTKPRPGASTDIGAGRVIVMRPGYAELSEHRVTRRVVWLRWGPVPIDTLVRSIGDPSWATLSKQGVLTLKAGLFQRPGTELLVRKPVRTLRLVDSATSPAYLAGTRAAVSFSRVTVSSAAGKTTAPESAHRPFIRYVNRSRLSAVSSTFDGLGSLSTPHPGVTVGSGGVLTAVDSTFRAGGRGLDTYRAERVTLTRVSATGNTDAGIVIAQPRTTVLRDVTTTDNTGSGLVLRSPRRTPAIGGTVLSARNQAGAEFTGLGPGPVGPLHTEHNTTVGLLLHRCPRCAVTGLTAIDERIAVRMDRGSTAARLDNSSVVRASTVGVRIEGGGVRLTRVAVAPTATGVGVRVRSGVESVQIASSSVGGGAIAVSTDGSRTTISDVAVAGSQVGVRIGGDAEQATVSRVQTTGTQVGLVANTGSRAIAVDSLRVSQQGGRGIKSTAEELSVHAAEVSGADVGLELKGGAAVSASTVSDVEEAVRAGSGGRLQFIGSTLRARVLGLRTSPSSNVVLSDSTVEAPRGAYGSVVLRGNTQFPARPIRWIGVFGLVILLVGIGLEITRRLRERDCDRTSQVPEHVIGKA
jgi:hypothetical protein